MAKKNQTDKEDSGSEDQIAATCEAYGITEEHLMGSDSEDQIAAACEAYGITEEHLMGSACADGVVTLVTIGGSKVTWQHGMEVKPLTSIQITGINPANDHRKPITGGKR